MTPRISDPMNPGTDRPPVRSVPVQTAGGGAAMQPSPRPAHHVTDGPVEAPAGKRAPSQAVGVHPAEAPRAPRSGAGPSVTQTATTEGREGALIVPPGRRPAGGTGDWPNPGLALPVPLATYYGGGDGEPTNDRGQAVPALARWLTRWRQRRYERRAANIRRRMSRLGEGWPRWWR